MNTGNTPIIKKEIKQDEEAISLLKEGIDLVADIVKKTLCPKGKNVIVRDSIFSKPRSINDGYYIAKGIEHDNPTINSGVDMMKQICASTNDRVGDGTTTTAILTQAFINEGLKAIKSGRNPVDVKNELNNELNIAIEHLKTISTPIKTMDDIENIAIISGNNDREIGKAVRKIKENLGMETPIITERHDRTELETKCINGIYFKVGYGEAIAFMSNPIKRIGELIATEENKVYVLLYDGDLNDINEAQQFVVNMANEYKAINKSFTDVNLLVICKVAPVSSAPMSFFARNNILKLENKANNEGNLLGFRCIVLETPRMIGFQSDVLEDLAGATGGKVVGGNSGTKLKDVKPSEVLGTADKVIVGVDDTIITGGGGNKSSIDVHIMGLQEELKVCTQIEKKESLQARINMLGTGIGIIKAGGVTMVETRERETRVEDAILATKAAIEEGVVVGGGSAYIKIANVVKSEIFKEACRAVPKQILENCGKPRDQITDGKGYGKNFGFNALTGEYEDLVKAGVLDATKVLRVSLENAVSFASILLTTSASITEYEKILD